MEVSEIHLPKALTQDIIKAGQKDDVYKHSLRSMITALLPDLIGQRRAAILQSRIILLSDSIYYGLTTLLGSQTLGQEYTDIIETYDNSQPHWIRRFMLLLLQVFSQTALSHISGKIPFYEFVKDTLVSAHLAVFYFYGIYYYLPHRILSIRFIKKLRVGEENGYEILGFLVFAKLALQFMKPPPVLDYDDSKVAGKGRCSLCLEGRKDATAASCGHVFCWRCICDWIRTREECPLCRKAIQSNTLVKLQNYGSS